MWKARSLKNAIEHLAPERLTGGPVEPASAAGRTPTIWPS